MFPIRILLLPQLMPRAHPLERLLEMKPADNNRIDLAMIVIEIVNCGDPRFGLARIRRDPMHLELILHGRG